MTRRKRTGTAGKREPRTSGIALYDEDGVWIGKFEVDTVQITTAKGTISQPGTKAHNLRVTMALKWIAENRPDLIASVVDPEPTEEEVSEDV